ncbi:MAG: hypothetical protein QNJ55_05030 [Xenococcus sp. MO_188.B8]|nr:hypothetical protein [Xenococcus sp. MO_188.B8]
MKLEIASRADILLLVFISAIALPDSKKRSPVFKESDGNSHSLQGIGMKVA